MPSLAAAAVLALEVALQEAAAVNAGGRIAGRVLSTYPAGESSVVVTLQRVDRPAAERRTTTTDSNGRFSFERVPDGRYVATAEKPGYTSRTVNAADARFDEGVELTVRSGRTVADVDIRLRRTTASDRGDSTMRQCRTG